MIDVDKIRMAINEIKKENPQPLKMFITVSKKINVKEDDLLLPHLYTSLFNQKEIVNLYYDNTSNNVFLIVYDDEEKISNARIRVGTKLGFTGLEMLLNAVIDVIKEDDIVNLMYDAELFDKYHDKKERKYAYLKSGDARYYEEIPISLQSAIMATTDNLSDCVRIGSICNNHPVFLTDDYGEGRKVYMCMCIEQGNENIPISELEIYSLLSAKVVHERTFYNQ